MYAIIHSSGSTRLNAAKVRNMKCERMVWMLASATRVKVKNQAADLVDGRSEDQAVDANL